MELHIAYFGGTAFQHRMSGVLERLGNMRPGYMAAWALFRQYESEQFAGQGVGPHGAWTGLKESTQIKKARLGLDPRILHATLGLRNSLTRRGSKWGTFRMTRDQVTFGTRHPTSGLHQSGTQHMPERRVVDLRLEQRRALVAEVRKFMLEPLHAN